MKIRKTKAGWVLEITDQVHGMLEQGGVCGREELFKQDTLEICGISYDDDPNGDYNEFVTNAEYLQHCVRPDIVLKKGTKIL